jgi:hypothetical protein
VSALPKQFARGSYLPQETLTFIPETSTLRCLRDQLIIEPLDVVFSRYLIVPQGKPIRGICRVAGPGVYPNRYDHPEKHKRTKVMAGMAFRPTETKVGDIVWAGGLERTYNFEQFWHGDTLLFHCRDEDIVCIEQ